MNLFQKAIEKNELLKFALGKNEYFIADRDFGDHSVLNSWINNILPLVESKGQIYVDEAIEKMLTEILFSVQITSEEKNENLLYQLHVYYYFKHENRIKAKDLTNLNSRLLESLLEYSNFFDKTHSPKAKAFKAGQEWIHNRGGLFM